MTSGTADLIDGALRDRMVGKDAMRWVPDGERAPVPFPALPPPGPGAGGGFFRAVGTAADLRPLEVMFSQLGEALAGALRQLASFARAMAPVVRVLDETRAERVSAMHREYRRRSAARRRRGRGR